MRPIFQPSLVNGPFADPALFVDVLFERRALLFDLGDIADAPDCTPVTARWREGDELRERRLSLGTLRHAAVQCVPGQMIAYVSDVACHADNLQRIIRLVADADLLFIEATFLECDAEEARRKDHLTARQAGSIARGSRARNRPVPLLASLHRLRGGPGKRGPSGLSRNHPMRDAKPRSLPATIDTGDAVLQGDVVLPHAARGVVLFAHGSGSSRFSTRNRYVANHLVEGGLGTLLFDLLTAEEEERDMRDAGLRFDIDLLTRRLAGATRWLGSQDWATNLRPGYFGASTGAAAALAASVECEVHAIVSRGGRPDLAGAALPRVTAPTLLIVGSQDPVVIELNEQALRLLQCEARLEIVPGATHLFEEPGTLEQVAALALQWFRRWLS